MKKKTEQGLEKMGVMNLLKTIILTTSQTGELLPEESMPFIEACQRCLNCETPMQVVLLSAFIERYDDSYVEVKDIAHHFGVPRIEILTVEKELDFFVKRGIICKRKTKSDGVIYKLSPDVIPALQENRLPEVKSKANLTIEDLLNEVNDILEIVYYDESSLEYCCEMLVELFKENMQLHVAKEITALRLSNRELLTFSIMLKNAAFDSDYIITKDDLRKYMPPVQARSEMASFRSGESELVKHGIVEPTCISGQVDTGSWSLTNTCLREMLRELNLSIASEKPSNKLTSHKEIEEKPLFFSDEVSREYMRLGGLLQAEKMEEILANLERHKMRKCFTCIFYGDPGTGKTESVRQLARQSGRDIMLVDIPSIRSKWVGDTEKNIKAVFERYRKMVKSERVAPILLFNEADAILGRRNERCVDSVDKMENAMQDIILQEMETLEGIMIATSNISGNLDKAFERRFLYKIRFEQPTAKARREIWKSMLPDLQERDCEILAERYEFSGGEIENVARKYVIEGIINGRNGDVTLLKELCDGEKLRDVKRGNVGFCV